MWTELKLAVGFTAIVSLLGLAACDTPKDFGPYVADYERAYRAQHPYETSAVPRGGNHLYARVFGTQHAPGGPTFLLMHGFPDSLHLYDGIAPLLAATRQTVAFDFLGWGESDKPADHVYDTPSLIADIDAAIQHFALSHVVLVAHDASGPPAIEWALANPDRVSALVLLNTYYSRTPTLKPPEAIARYSKPGLWRDIQVRGAMYSDSRWQAGFMEQVSKFFANREAREKYLPVLAHQALGIRPAFFGLNKVLEKEIEARNARLPALRTLDRPVRIVFGAADPYLKPRRRPRLRQAVLACTGLYHRQRRPLRPTRPPRARRRTDPGRADRLSVAGCDRTHREFVLPV